MLSNTQYLKVTMTDLTNQGQFIQYRNNEKLEPDQYEESPFFGCNAPEWNVQFPDTNLPWLPAFTNDTFFIDAGDLSR